MHAYVTACNLMDLYAFCIHFGTFRNILQTVWNILHTFWNILKDVYICFLGRISTLNSDIQTLGLVELGLRS